VLVLVSDSPLFDTQLVLEFFVFLVDFRHAYFERSVFVFEVAADLHVLLAVFFSSLPELLHVLQ